MEKYRRVDKSKEETPENEIRVRADTRKRVHPTGKYLRYAMDLLTGEKKQSSIVIKGTGSAIPKTLALIELIKHREVGLYQKNEILSLDIEDEYEPLEEGLDRLVFKRKVTMLQVTLSKTP